MLCKMYQWNGAFSFSQANFIKKLRELKFAEYLQLTFIGEKVIRVFISNAERKGLVL